MQKGGHLELHTENPLRFEKIDVISPECGGVEVYTNMFNSKVICLLHLYPTG